jgi:hypothetical protein
MKEHSVGPRERIVELVLEYLDSTKAMVDDIEAIYLWGSILRLDFDPDSSDIDCVAIGELTAQDPDVLNLQDNARAKYKELAQLNIRLLYLCDLNGAGPHSELAQLIDPRLLLADFSSWTWVWGRHLTLSDFTLRACNLHEAYSVRLGALKGRLQRCLAVPRTESPRYVLKEAGYLIHLIHQLSNDIYPFSYNELVKRSDEMTKKLSRVIVSARSRGWPEMECERAVLLVLDLLDQIAERDHPIYRLNSMFRANELLV